MKFETAFGTFFRNFAGGRQHRAALRTAGYGAFGSHLQGTRTEGVFLWRSIAGPLARLLRLVAAILISVLPIFAIGQS
jgi:hypothetical protein